MVILPRYIIRAHLPPFLFGASVVMFLFLMQFLLRVLDELVGKGLSATVIAQLIVLNLAWMVVLAVPIGMLFSALITFGRLAQTHEVTAMKASGMSLLQMMLPVIAMGGVLTLAVFWFNDSVLPDANHRAKTLLMDIQRKKPSFALQAGQFSTQLEGYTILARAIDTSQQHLRGVTIYDRRDINRLTIVNADSGFLRFSPSYRYVLLELYHGDVHQYSRIRRGDYRYIRFERQHVVIPAYGFLLERSQEGAIARGDREMRIADMERIVRAAREATAGAVAARSNRLLRSILRGCSATLHHCLPTAGQNTSPSLQVSLAPLVGSTTTPTAKHGSTKWKFKKSTLSPSLALCLYWSDCPLGIRTRGGSFGTSALISVGFYILYWACLIGGEKLADRQILPPEVMWSANVLLAVIGVMLIITTSNESFRLLRR